MKFYKGLLCAVFSAVLMWMSLPNDFFYLGIPFGGLIALVPLYFMLLHVKGVKAAVLLGIYGSLHHLTSSYWLYFFHGFAIYTLGSTTIAYFFVYLVFGLYLSLGMRSSAQVRPLVFACGWVLFEYGKSIGFLGYPWGLLAYTQSTFLSFLQLADITGVYGITFILAFINATITEIWNSGFSKNKFKFEVTQLRNGLTLTRGYAIKLASLAIILYVCNLAYGLVRTGQDFPVKGYINTVIVQQNSDPWSAEEMEGLASNIRLARGALAQGLQAEPQLKPDIIAFSEGSLERPIDDQSRAIFTKEPRGDPLIPFIKEIAVPLLTGSVDVANPSLNLFYNTAILVEPQDAQVVQSYAKRHLVPFAELVPFWEFAGFRSVMESIGMGGSFAIGNTLNLFPLTANSVQYQFATPICFEDAMAGDVREMALKGADFFFNLTNNAWSHRESAEWQHFASARFRAIEFRRTLIRSTSTGVSTVVGVHGDILKNKDGSSMLLPLFKESAALYRVPIYASNPTFYLVFGDLFAWLCCLFFALFCIQNYFVLRRQGYVTQP